MSLPKILTIVQARMGSSRLPGKVLLPLAGQPLLVRMTERVRRAPLAGTVVVATTTDAADDAIADLCAAHGLECFRGNPLDLLDRHYQAARHYAADVVLKIPSDCPLIDPAVIDEAVRFYLDFAERYDFVSNLHPATFPDGNDVEVMPFEALETAWREARRPLEREHTTPFFWENPRPLPPRQRGVGRRPRLFDEPPLDHRLPRRLRFHKGRVRGGLPRKPDLWPAGHFSPARKTPGHRSIECSLCRGELVPPSSG